MKEIKNKKNYCKFQSWVEIIPKSGVYISDFVVVFPYQADQDGNFLSHDLQPHSHLSQSHRSRRSTSSTKHSSNQDNTITQEIFYKFHTPREVFHLKLKPRLEFLSPGFRIHHRRPSNIHNRESQNNKYTHRGKEDNSQRHKQAKSVSNNNNYDTKKEKTENHRKYQHINNHDNEMFKHNSLHRKNYIKSDTVDTNVNTQDINANAQRRHQRSTTRHDITQHTLDSHGHQKHYHTMDTHVYQIDHHCFYTGSIVNMPQSRVTISLCEGLVSAH